MNYKYGLTIDKRFSLLKKYMVEFVDALPGNIKSFESWIDAYMETGKNLGSKAVAKSFLKRCAYCKRYFDDTAIVKTKDHVVPVSKGGVDLKINRVPCCYDCNQWKDDKMLKNWLEEVKYILKKEKWRPPYDKKILTIMITGISQQIEHQNKNKKKISKYKT